MKVVIIGRNTEDSLVSDEGSTLYSSPRLLHSDLSQNFSQQEMSVALPKFASLDGINYHYPTQDVTYVYAESGSIAPIDGDIYVCVDDASLYENLQELSTRLLARQSSAIDKPSVWARMRGTSLPVKPASIIIATADKKAFELSESYGQIRDDTSIIKAQHIFSWQAPQQKENVEEENDEKQSSVNQSVLVKQIHHYIAENTQKGFIVLPTLKMCQEVCDAFADQKEHKSIISLQSASMAYYRLNGQTDVNADVLLRAYAALEPRFYAHQVNEKMVAIRTQLKQQGNTVEDRYSALLLTIYPKQKNVLSKEEFSAIDSKLKYLETVLNLDNKAENLKENIASYLQYVGNEYITAAEMKLLEHYKNTTIAKDVIPRSESYKKISRLVDLRRNIAHAIKNDKNDSSFVDRVTDAIEKLLASTWREHGLDFSLLEQRYKKHVGGSVDVLSDEALLEEYWRQIEAVNVKKRTYSESDINSLSIAFREILQKAPIHEMDTTAIFALSELYADEPEAFYDRFKQACMVMEKHIQLAEKKLSEEIRSFLKNKQYNACPERTELEIEWSRFQEKPYSSRDSLITSSESGSRSRESLASQSSSEHSDDGSMTPPNAPSSPVSYTTLRTCYNTAKKAAQAIHPETRIKSFSLSSLFNPYDNPLPEAIDPRALHTTLALIGGGDDANHHFLEERIAMLRLFYEEAENSNGEVAKVRSNGYTVDCVLAENLRLEEGKHHDVYGYVFSVSDTPEQLRAKLDTLFPKKADIFGDKNYVYPYCVFMGNNAEFRLKEGEIREQHIDAWMNIFKEYAVVCYESITFINNSVAPVQEEQESVEALPTAKGDNPNIVRYLVSSVLDRQIANNQSRRDALLEEIAKDLQETIMNCGLNTIEVEEGRCKETLQFTQLKKALASYQHKSDANTLAALKKAMREIFKLTVPGSKETLFNIAVEELNASSWRKPTVTVTTSLKKSSFEAYIEQKKQEKAVEKAALIGILKKLEPFVPPVAKKSYSATMSVKNLRTVLRDYVGYDNVLSQAVQQLKLSTWKHRLDLSALDEVYEKYQSMMTYEDFKAKEMQAEEKMSVAQIMDEWPIKKAYNHYKNSLINALYNQYIPQQTAAIAIENGGASPSVHNRKSVIYGGFLGGLSFSYRRPSVSSGLPVAKGPTLKECFQQLREIKEENKDQTKQALLNDGWISEKDTKAANKPVIDKQIDSILKDMLDALKDEQKRLDLQQVCVELLSVLNTGLESSYGTLEETIVPLQELGASKCVQFIREFELAEKKQITKHEKRMPDSDDEYTSSDEENDDISCEPRVVFR